MGDFTALPEHLTGFDLAFAIESFVHADPASAFFREVAGALLPGGALVVIDDFRTGDRGDGRLDDFRTGWHASSLMTVPEAAALAADAGLDLVASRDLSPLQRLGRPRDRVVHAAQPRAPPGARRARCGPSRWSAATRSRPAIATACSSTACCASSADRADRAHSTLIE